MVAVNFLSLSFEFLLLSLLVIFSLEVVFLSFDLLFSVFSPMPVSLGFLGLI